MADPGTAMKETPSQAPSATQTEQRVDQSRRFLTFLRGKLRDSDSRYDEFLKIMAQFKEHRYRARRIDIEGVCRKVQDLFKANKQILVEFNRLIPADFRLQVQPVSPMQAIVHYQGATQYMLRVKVRLIWTCTNYHRMRPGRTPPFTLLF